MKIEQGGEGCLSFFGKAWGRAGEMYRMGEQKRGTNKYESLLTQAIIAKRSDNPDASKCLIERAVQHKAWMISRGLIDPAEIILERVKKQNEP